MLIHDIITQSFDKVVMFCIKVLSHILFLSLTVGGPDIQKECDDYMRGSGELAAGKVYVSGPGQLPCKKVIHAVGPRWKGGQNNEDNDLYEATYGSLQAAENSGLSSVAFPALCCGIFGYPVSQASRTIINALKDFLEDPQHTCVKKVSLVNQSDQIVRELNNSLGVVFGSSVMVSAQAAQGSSHETGK